MSQDQPMTNGEGYVQSFVDQRPVYGPPMVDRKVHGPLTKLINARLKMRKPTQHKPLHKKKKSKVL